MKQKLDHIWGAVETDTNQVDVTALQNQVTAIDTRLTSLSNVTAKTNVTNTFTANQNVNGQLKCNTFLLDNSGKKFQADVIDYQNKKYCRLMFVDGSTDRFMIEFNYNDNEVSFKRGNVKVSAPTIGDHIANKQYVDSLKTELKNIVSQSTDFANFKTRIGSW